ncbi:LysR substrate-binding domain-containing protein [Allorhizobium pseudoryzae]|uniref:LysR substrate-binding domain-containing protein n=1 Tax=Allorhizobium pseudoryzae TaxID=379684 RepID=UPI003CFFDD32
MRFKNLDLNLLVALDALIRLRNVSRAAEEMFITQSAMSNALGRLREYFDDPLLIQVGRTMELSPLAVSLEQPLRDIIVRIDSAVVSTPSFNPADSRRVIGMVVSDYSLHTLIPIFLAIAAAEAPGLQFDFKPQQNFPHLLLEKGEADLLIAPSVFCSTQHPSDVLFADEICCVTDSSSRFAEGERITREQFETSGHVVMRPPNGGESFAERACREVGLAIRVEVSTYAFSTLSVLVRRSNRLALVQKTLATEMLKTGGLTMVAPPLDLPLLEQSAQWHSYRSRDPALTWVRERLKSAATILTARDQNPRGQALL